MIHIMSTVSSIINFRNPCKDFECCRQILFGAVFDEWLHRFWTLPHSHAHLMAQSVWTWPKWVQGLWDTPDRCSRWEIPSMCRMNFASWANIKEKWTKCIWTTKAWPLLLCLEYKFFSSIWGWPRACAGIPGEDVLGTSSSLGLGLICWIGAKHAFVRFLPELMWPDFKRLCCPSPATLWPWNRHS